MSSSIVRTIGAVVAGYVAWTIIWLGANAVLLGAASETMARGEPLTEVKPLAIALGASVVCSIVAGLIAGLVGKSRRAPAVVAILLLLTGIGVQASAWSLMPTWYHLAFLVLLVPVTLVGGRIACARGGARS